MRKAVNPEGHGFFVQFYCIKVTETPGQVYFVSNVRLMD